MVVILRGLIRNITSTQANKNILPQQLRIIFYHDFVFHIVTWITQRSLLTLTLTRPALVGTFSQQRKNYQEDKRVVNTHII